MYRQGDVALVKVDVIPDGAKEMKNKGIVVLAEGEVTGHAHKIENKEVCVFEVGDEMYLYVPDKSDATLVHEEHASIVIAPGKYKVQRQVEYSPQEIRRVAD